MPGRASPGGSIALRTRWSRLSLEGTVPSLPPHADRQHRFAGQPQEVVGRVPVPADAERPAEMATGGPPEHVSAFQAGHGELHPHADLHLDGPRFDGLAAPFEGARRELDDLRL